MKNIGLQVEMTSYRMNDEEKSMWTTIEADVFVCLIDSKFLGLKFWHNCCCLKSQL